jgi:hypothetical protein
MCNYVDVPDSVISFNQTPIVWCGCKNGLKKENGLHAQNIITFLDSKVFILGEDIYNFLMNTRLFTLMINMIV